MALLAQDGPPVMPLSEIIAISRRIVHLHGGRITVRSELGVGSCFRVSLPHGSTVQYHATSRVSLSNIRRGDILFYSSNGSLSGTAHGVSVARSDRMTSTVA